MSAKRASATTTTANAATSGSGNGDGRVSVLRQHAEQQFAEELEALAKVDDRQRPPSWKLSPWAVLQYLMGGKLDNGFTIVPKYIGSKRLMEIAIATLATDRALLLLGVGAKDGDAVGRGRGRRGRRHAGDSSLNAA